METLARLALQGRTANDRSGPNYAPAAFAKEPEARLAGVGKAALADAMRELFAEKKIRVDEDGSGNHKVRRIVPV